ncbi:MAG: NACHT domain-containing protein, partial [Gammaproteobacteria bacterium]|nr:NACHT domain-containing protein [Gammaproteobacteria bacterium]
MGDAQLSHLTAIGTQKKEKNLINKGTINYIQPIMQPSSALLPGASFDREAGLVQANIGLKRSYRRNIAMPYLLQKKATQTLYNCYLPLTCIKYVEHEVGGVNTPHHALSASSRRVPVQEKDYEQRYSQECAIEVNHLWKPSAYAGLKEGLSHLPPTPERLVIRGAAGTGKTTLLRCITAYWGKEEAQSGDERMDVTGWHQHFKIVLYIPLRKLLTYTPPSADTEGLAAFLHTCYNAYLTPTDALVLAQSIGGHALTLNKPEQILLLLDGFDEVSSLLESFR